MKGPLLLTTKVETVILQESFDVLRNIQRSSTRGMVGN
jgi:hypothetical protein